MNAPTSLPDDFPARRGPRPATTAVNPHTQLDQNAPIELQDRLRNHAAQKSHPSSPSTM